MLDFNLDENFGVKVAHRLHSLTLEDLRYYYKDDAPLDNGVPTVNPNLPSNLSRVLANAPLNGYDTSFKTLALRHTDMILSKMDNKDWGIRYYTALESLVHAHHMSEMWERSKTHYEKLMKSPYPQEVCSCVRDIKETGLMAELQLLALKIKYPGLTGGEQNLPYGRNSTGKDPRDRVYYLLTYSRSYSRYFIRLRSADKEAWEKFMEKLLNFDFGGDEEDVVERVMNELQDGDKGVEGHLTSEEVWNEWKEGFQSMDDAGNYQFAVFIYCTLNK